MADNNDCIPCRQKKRVNNELYEIRKQRAIQWGKVQGLDVVALILPEEADELPTFCRTTETNGRKHEIWWCGAD